MTDNAEAIAAWEDYCDGLKAAGRDILSAAQEVEDPLTQAEGLRYLTRLVRSGFERQMEYADPLDPFMAPTRNERLRWGLDNPDSIYLMTEVDGRYEYELTGNVGTVRYFNLTASQRGEDSRQVTTGFLDGKDFKTDAEGNFTIHLGGPPRAENWLELKPGPTSIMLRELFGVRAAETPLSCRIRRVSDVGPIPPLQLADVTRRLRSAGQFVAGTGRTFLGLGRELALGENRMPPSSEATMKAMGGDPNYAYFWSTYRVAPDEALLVHLPQVPECENWGLCLYNYWLESHDYTRAQINLGKFTATPNPDGSVTMVIAHRRPQGGEWLDACDHVLGAAMFRWTSARPPVAPLTRLVKLAEVDWPQVLRRWEG